jgi:transcriptional regulator with XRE-family HTH domain
MRNEKLVEAREQRGWSQEVAAEKVGVTRVAYARWEEQGITPRLWAINKAREAFKMTAEQLGFRKYPTSAANNRSLITGSPVRVLRMPVAEATADVFNVAVSVLALAQQVYGCTLNELLFRLEQEMRRLDTMEQQQNGVSRRQALQFLAELPLVMLGLRQVGSNQSALNAVEILPLYTTSIPACWRLYYGGEWLDVERVLPTYISHLTPLAHEASKYQQSIASLLSQAHQLASEITIQREDFGASLEHCKQALIYGQVAGDPNLQAGSLIRKGNALFYRNPNRSNLDTYLEAMQYIDYVSPLLRGRIYSEVGLKQGTEQDMLRYLGMAHESTPDNPEDDAYYLYSHSDHYILYFNDALAHLKLGQANDAWKAINQAATYVPDVVNARRMELLKYLVICSIASSDLDQGAHHFKVMVESASVLSSDLWLGDIQDTHQQMLVKWPTEQRVKALADMFR